MISSDESAPSVFDSVSVGSSFSCSRLTVIAHSPQAYRVNSEEVIIKIMTADINGAMRAVRDKDLIFVYMNHKDNLLTSVRNEGDTDF